MTLLALVLLAQILPSPPRDSAATSSGSGQQGTARYSEVYPILVQGVTTLPLPSGNAFVDTLAIQNAVAKYKYILIPASPTCYQWSASVHPTSTQTLQGQGSGSPGQGATCIVTTASGCGITIDSVTSVSVRDLDIEASQAGSTTNGICVFATTANPLWVNIERVSFTSQVARAAGSVGLALLDNGLGIYWGSYRDLIFKGWETSFSTTVTGTTNGVNDNKFWNLVSYSHVTAFSISGGTKQATDNKFYGLSCSRSDGSYAGNQDCILAGADGTTVWANSFIGVDADQGSPSTCGQFGTNTAQNLFVGNCNAGGGFANNSTVTNFYNSIWNLNGLGSLAGLLDIGNLKTRQGATIVGQSFFGKTGGSTGTGAGDHVQIGGGASGGSGLNGGDLDILGGSGLGQTNGGGGNVLVAPGLRNGTGQGGAVVVGPLPGLTVNSGFKVNSGRVTKYRKPFAISDCGAGPSQSATVSLLEEGSRFSTSNACTLTIPTAAGVSGIVQAMVGYSGAPVAVGECFNFTMISIGAVNYTLAAGAGVTILGNATISNTKKEWELCVTAVSAGTETAVVY